MAFRHFLRLAMLHVLLWLKISRFAQFVRINSSLSDVPTVIFFENVRFFISQNHQSFLFILGIVSNFQCIRATKNLYSGE